MVLKSTRCCSNLEPKAPTEQPDEHRYSMVKCIIDVQTLETMSLSEVNEDLENRVLLCMNYLKTSLTK